MAYNANILLGRIAKVHGFEGSVSVRLEKNFIENIPDMESVFLEIDGKPVPFFIQKSEYPGGDLLRIKFEGYNTADQVTGFTGCLIFLTAGEGTENSDNVRAIVNYHIMLPDGTSIGTVREVVENPGQWLLIIVTSSGKELLVPFHDDLILSADKKKKIIVMDLPEGLLEIN